MAAKYGRDGGQMATKDGRDGRHGDGRRIKMGVSTYRNNKRLQELLQALDAERTSSPDAKEGTRSFDRSVLLTDDVFDSMK